MSIELTKEELDSALWKKLKSHMAESLLSCRKRNDHFQPDTDTHMTRGDIRTYKALLRLDPDWKD